MGDGSRALAAVAPGVLLTPLTSVLEAMGARAVLDRAAMAAATGATGAGTAAAATAATAATAAKNQSQFARTRTLLQRASNGFSFRMVRESVYAMGLNQVRSSHCSHC